jgi:hypothetical protein
MARLQWTEPFWDGKRKPFVTAVPMSSLLLILLFFVNMSYIYGSLFNDTTRTKGMNILAVDYDAGIIGQSLKAAYVAVKADEFPTLHFRPATDFATIEDVRHAVCVRGTIGQRSFREREPLNDYLLHWEEVRRRSNTIQVTL